MSGYELWGAHGTRLVYAKRLDRNIEIGVVHSRVTVAPSDARELAAGLIALAERLEDEDRQHEPG